MKRLFLFVFILPLLSGCAHAGWFSGLFTVKAADQIKAADTIKGADKVQGEAFIGSKSTKTVNNTTTTETKSGRDTSISNDSAVIQSYIKAGMIDSRIQAKMYERIIKYLIIALCVFIAWGYFLMGAIIGFMLYNDFRRDREVSKYVR